MSSDKLEQHYGQQLSALMDGELAPDQARFLLRRLQHDGELAGSWERWQLAGDVLRGRAGVLLPGGFAERVGVALGAEAPATATRRTPGLLHWGGIAALAASVAVVALMVPRQMAAPGDAPQVAATPVTPPSGPQPVFVLPPRVAEPAGVAQPRVAAPARVLASRDVATPAIDRDRNRSLTPVSAPPRAATPPDRTADAVAATASPSPEQAVRDPFSEAVLVQRPWPRAVLPQFGSNGALATGLPAGDSPRQPSFYPFEPRLPGAGGSGQGVGQGDRPDPDLPPQAPY